MAQILLTLQIFIGLALIVLIVVFQQGRGADAGASFGGGSSGSLFGSRGPASFLFKLTSGLAVLFFINSLALAMVASQSLERRSVIDQFDFPIAATTPASTVSELPDALPEGSNADDDVPQAPTQ